jgi:hypothetical protein
MEQGLIKGYKKSTFNKKKIQFMIVDLTKLVKKIRYKFKMSLKIELSYISTSFRSETYEKSLKFNKKLRNPADFVNEIF